jgi:Putative addiction module component
MAVQYIHDSKGKPTGVFIPIADWKNLKKKYVEIEDETPEIQLHDWHKKLIDERLAEHEKNPNNTISFKELINSVKESR